MIRFVKDDLVARLLENAPPVKGQIRKMVIMEFDPRSRLNAEPSNITRRELRG